MNPTLSSRKARKTVIWAVDAFEDANWIRQNTLQVIRSLQRKFDIHIQPIYVLTPGQLNLSVEFAAPWIDQYCPAAERALNKLLDDLNLPELRNPKVLCENLSSTRDAVKSLANHALLSGADLIIVSTHARVGLKRLVLGSFTETLLHHAKVPVMCIGPVLRKNLELDRVLFPTDFGLNSHHSFREAVRLAKDLNSEILVYHAIPRPIEPVFQSGVYLLGGSWVPVQAYFSAQAERQHKRAGLWVKWAEHQGVRVEVMIDPQVGSIADRIISLARKREVGFIAIQSQSGPVSSALLGSITRQVIRRADCPVWVIRKGSTSIKQKTRRAA